MFKARPPATLMMATLSNTPIRFQPIVFWKKRPTERNQLSIIPPVWRRPCDHGRRAPAKRALPDPYQKQPRRASRAAILAICYSVGNKAPTLTFDNNGRQRGVMSESDSKSDAAVPRRTVLKSAGLGVGAGILSTLGTASQAASEPDIWSQDYWARKG